VIATSAPALAAASAIARPIPLDAPVTKSARPVKSSVNLVIWSSGYLVIELRADQMIR
jgi:hypothetical protein